METHEYEKLNKGKPDLTGSCVCGRPYDDLCHSKAPENKLPALEQASQAPTDESWEKEFYEEYHVDLGNIALIEDIKSFIASLLQKEREKDQKILDEYIDAQYEAGKSEALSLVRTILKKLQDNADYISIKGMGYREAVKEISLELSTLEGK